MPKVTMLKTDGTQAGEIELSEFVFGAEVNESLIHQAVVTQLANMRHGTQCALTRAEVRGGGIKPFRQKGTGRARQGSSRSPQYAHGGTVFAPKPRSYNKKMNKIQKQIAIVSALSMKLRDSELIVVDAIEIEAKTKAAVKMLDAIKADGKALIITDEKKEALVRATNNLPGVKTAIAGSFSVYDIVNCDKLVLTADAVKAIEGVYA
ncbi:MAG: 50S ribosomal protein L4 [Christensenellaceae bacterium]|nr:50S ribosomal protein L4 [Christensenellaceae bacterium]